jgi:prepilin-type N-terminal cleavage/methylation domain-containing protein
MSKKNIQGFTLIEVLVSTALIGFAAILSLSIISTINKNQISTRDNVKYVWVTKSIKSAFNEYLNSVDATNFVVNETIFCTSSSGGLNAKQTLINQLCNAENFLGNTKNMVTLTLLQSAAKNGTYFYWARVRIINKLSSTPSAPAAADIYFERLFINQK